MQARINKVLNPILLFISIFTASHLFGQENANPEPTKENRKFKIGVNFSPDICNNPIKKEGTPLEVDFINALNKEDIIKFGYTYGLNLLMNINRFLGIEIGAQYSNKGFQVDMKNTIFGDITDPRRGDVPSSFK